MKVFQEMKILEYCKNIVQSYKMQTNRYFLNGSVQYKTSQYPANNFQSNMNFIKQGQTSNRWLSIRN